MSTSDSTSTLKILKSHKWGENAAVFKIPSVASLSIPFINQVCSSQNTLRFLSKLLLSFSCFLSSVAIGLSIRELKVWPMSYWKFRKTKGSLEIRLNYLQTTCGHWAKENADSYINSTWRNLATQEVIQVNSQRNLTNITTLMCLYLNTQQNTSKYVIELQRWDDL